MSTIATQLVVIQATPFCNIDCNYCYLPNRSDKRTISEATLTAICRALSSFEYTRPSIEVLWHAGEPLVLPPEFYDRAFRIMRECLGPIGHRHIIQTNGTLLTQGWCDFIKREQVSIGLSIDGPADVHDANRPYRSGRGSFDRTLRGLRLLQENGITFSVIMVLTSASVTQYERIWDFCVEHGLQRIAFNAEEIEGANRTSSMNGERSLEKYQEFLEYFDRKRRETDFWVDIRELDRLEERIRSAAFPPVCSTNSPFHIMSFDLEGNVSTYCPELLSTNINGESYHFGNVNDKSLAEIFGTQKFGKNFAEIEVGKAMCADQCGCFSLCGGGNPSNKISEHGTFATAQTMNCRYKIQVPAEVVLTRLERSHGLA